MTFRDSEPIEQASSISFPSFTYFPRPSKDDIYSFSNTNIAPAPGPHVLPTTVLFPAPFDNTEIPMNTLARNTNSAYRLSNPNNPYVNSGLSKSKSRQSNLGHKSYGYVNDIFEANPLTAWAQVKDHNLVVNGLPTLEQILMNSSNNLVLIKTLLSGAKSTITTSFGPPCNQTSSEGRGEAKLNQNEALMVRDKHHTTRKPQHQLIRQLS
jgi:hypothetical protein